MDIIGTDQLGLSLVPISTHQFHSLHPICGDGITMWRLPPCSRTDINIRCSSSLKMRLTPMPTSSTEMMKGNIPTMWCTTFPFQLPPLHPSSPIHFAHQ